MSTGRFALLALALGLAGCQTVEAPLPPPAPVARSSIDGAAQFHTGDGRLLSCTGLSVALMADSARARARFLALYGSIEHAIQPVAIVKARAARSSVPGDPPVGSAQCDARGVFVFPDVAPGDYFLIAHVREQSAGRVGGDEVLLQQVTVDAGETRHVRLAP
jgi:hypothetical protein